MTQLLILFIVLNIINVIIQTIKSIVTVKCGKTVASVVNALAYGLYTVVTVYTMCDLPLLTKALVVAVCNLIGVYVVKLIEEKARKEKLWKIEMTIPTQYTTAVDLDLAEIPHNYIKLSDKHTLFNFYCATQKETIKVKEIVNQYGAKYFISETKNF
jgi:uncharacterized protein YebE (UPF0316 family)